MGGNNLAYIEDQGLWHRVRRYRDTDQGVTWWVSICRIAYPTDMFGGFSAVGPITCLECIDGAPWVDELWAAPIEKIELTLTVGDAE